MPLFNTLKFIADHPLNKNAKIRALIKFFRWQIGSRLIPGGGGDSLQLGKWIKNDRSPRRDRSDGQYLLRIA